MLNPLPIPFTTVNYFIGLRPPKHRYLYSYSQPSINSSDCVLQTQIPLVIYNRQLLHRTASSFKPLMRDTWDFTFASIIPSCSFNFASIIPSCSFPFLRVIPTLFSFFLLKIFYFTCSCYFFQFELITCILC